MVAVPADIAVNTRARWLIRIPIRHASDTDPEMRLVFGWELDGAACPEVDPEAGGLGFAAVGPRGLVDVLERWLGLAGPPVPHVLRVAAFRRRLDAFVTTSSSADFVRDSFATDPWETAAELLRWRDELVLAGWNGSRILDGGERLALLAEIETHTDGLGPGLADRVALLRRTLAGETRRPPIERIRLVTPRRLLPPAWRDLLDRLAALGVPVEEDPEDIPADGDRDLDRVRAQLVRGQRRPFSGDGTFAVLEAGDPVQAAELVAGWLAARDRLDDLVIVRGDGSPLLDEILAAAGLPRIGGHRHTRFRGALQLLPLMFELMWKPLDPERLLEFLLAPHGPIPGIVGGRLAAALREEPGIGGDEWWTRWKEARKRWRDLLAERRGLAGDALDRAVAEDERDWRNWLDAFGRVDSDEGMAAGNAREWALALSRHLHRRAAAFDGADRADVDDASPSPGTAELLHRAAALCETFAEVVEMVGAARLPRHQVVRMVDAVLAEGAAAGQDDAEAAPWGLVDRPGQVWAPVNTVLWWDFRRPELPDVRIPWTERERRALEEAGVVSEPADRVIAREVFGWKAPFRHAGRGLLLVRLRGDAGREVADHPLWDEIVAGREDGDLERVRVRAETALERDRLTVAGIDVPRRSLASQPLPGLVTCWRVEKGRIRRRGAESASSVERLFGCPLAWTLAYAAGIRAGQLARLPDETRIAGLLAHAVAARLLKDGLPALEEVDIRVRRLLEELEPCVAAPLLLPERILLRASIRDRIVRAMRALVAWLRTCGATEVVCEVERAIEGWVDLGDGGTIGLKGRLDLAAVLADGRPVVLDLKWGRSSDHYRRSLSDRKRIQLHLYAMLETAHRGADDVEAFIFVINHLAFLDAKALGKIEWVDFWQEIRSRYREQAERLVNGEIVASGDDVPAGEAGERPFGMRSPCRFCDYGHLCGVRRLA